MRADERQRIKNIEVENKNFHLQLEKSERKYLTDTNLLEMEIKMIKDKNKKLEKENKELSKGYQKQAETEREKQFIESFGKMLEKTQKT